MMAVDRNVSNNELLVMGCIAAPFGVRGWLRVNAFTTEADNLLDYSPWYLNIKGRWQAVEPLAGRQHGKGLVVQLKECSDRDAAAALTGTEIGIYRSQLPPADLNEFYWTDLIGLRVINRDEQVLGVVDHLFETGANDVMVVKGEQQYLVPYITEGVIESVDLQAGIIRVDWDPDF